MEAMGTFETGLKLAALLISVSVNTGHKGFASIFGAASFFYTDSFLEATPFRSKVFKNKPSGRPPTAYPTLQCLFFSVCVGGPCKDFFIFMASFPLKRKS